MYISEDERSERLGFSERRTATVGVCVGRACVHLACCSHSDAGQRLSWSGGAECRHRSIVSRPLDALDTVQLAILTTGLDHCSKYIGYTSIDFCWCLQLHYQQLLFACCLPTMRIERKIMQVMSAIAKSVGDRHRSKTDSFCSIISNTQIKGGARFSELGGPGRVTAGHEGVR